jgi:hypothetical protein
MKIDKAEGATVMRTTVPSVVLVFELERSGPIVSWPQDPVTLGRIIGGVSEEWRELLVSIFDIDLEAADPDA